MFSTVVSPFEAFLFAFAFAFVFAFAFAFARAISFSSFSLKVCGKPGVPFFKEGLKALGLSAEEVVMVGDDVVSDVGGAQKAGIRGVLVRTGKFRYSLKLSESPLI